MAEHFSNSEVLNELKTELRALAKTKQTLFIITGIDAIEENEFTTWVSQMYDQIKSGHALAIERSTSKRFVELLNAFWIDDA
jgi:hypothetical protein